MTLTATYRTFILITILIFYSCKKDENFTSKISFLNGVISSTPVAFTLKADNILIADKIGFDSLKPDIMVPSGTYNVSLSSGSQSLLPFTTNLQANESYTAVVYDSAQRFQFFLRKDVFPATPGFGRCAVRIYNLIPGSSNLFLGSFIGTKGNNKDTAKAYITGKTFSDFANGTTSPVFTEIDTIARPKIYTADTIPLTPVLPSLLPGKIYTFYLTGSLKDTARLRPKCTVQLHN